MSRNMDLDEDAMNHDTTLSLATLLLAGLAIAIFVLLLTTSSAPASAVCLSKSEARKLWPRQHIYWYSADHCWSNRRGGPPRNLRYDLIRENHAQSLPASSDTPGAGKGDRAPVDASQPSRGTVSPSKVVKIVRAEDFNELDAAADANTFFNAKPFPYQNYVLNLDKFSATSWHKQIWGLAREPK